MKTPVRLVLVLVLVLVSSSIFLGSPKTRVSAGAPRQSAPSGLPAEARQFDFWLGNWNVTVAGSTNPVRNFVKPFGLGGGMAILEDYGVGPVTAGTSVSFYSRKTGKWIQTWFDFEETLIELEGGFQNGGMVIEGPQLTARGQRFLGRLSYFNIAPRTHDHQYDISTDNGKTWFPSFASHYVKASASLPESPGSGLAGTQTRSGTFTPSLLPAGFRQFDPLVGQWSVILSDRAGSGTANITNFGMGGGVAVLEEFKGPDDYVETSVSLYNNVSKLWRQIRLDSNGRHVELVGEVRNGKGVLTGDYVDPQTGNPVPARMTFDNVTPFGFTRTFETSTDSGTTWTAQSTNEFVQAGDALPDFELSVPAEPQTVKAGGSVDVIAAVKAKEGYSQPVAVTGTVSPATDAITVSASPASVAPGGTTTVKITASDRTTPGTYVVSVVGTAGGRKRSGTVTLTVTAASGNAAPTIAPISDQTVAPGEERFVSVSASDAEGASGLKLSASGLAYVTLADNGNGSGRLRIAPSATETQGGRVVVSVTDAGGLTAQTSFSVTVRAPDTQNPVVSSVVLSKSKIKRKKDPTLQITWNSTDNVAVASQSIIYAADATNFSLTVTAGLAGDAKSFTWTIPASVAKTKTGVVKVVARDAAGNMGEAVGPTFTIK